MKELQEIKNEVAKEKHYGDWGCLMAADVFGAGCVNDDLIDEVAKRYAEEALREAAKRAEAEDNSDCPPTVEKDSILNIIKELK